MIKIAIIIQARMGSTRLPGKVLKTIEGIPMLELQINRLKYSKFSLEIIIATSILKQDKPILKLAEELKVKSYAGSHEDVLDRYYQAALRYNINIVARITADCPLIDPEILDRMLEIFLEGNYDYISNVRPATFPDGLDIEIFSFETLERTWKEARKTSEREHVTGYIGKNMHLFKTFNFKYEEDFSEMRWTVDVPADFEFVKIVYKNLYHKKKIFLMKDILDLLKEKPELMDLNNKFIRNESYLKSLQNDKIVK